MSAEKFLTIHPILVETFKFGLKTVKHSHPQSHAAKMLIKHQQLSVYDSLHANKSTKVYPTAPPKTEYHHNQPAVFSSPGLIQTQSLCIIKRRALFTLHTAVNAIQVFIDSLAQTQREISGARAVEQLGWLLHLKVTIAYRTHTGM